MSLSPDTSPNSQDQSNQKHKDNKVNFQSGQLLFDNEVTTSQANLRPIERGSVIMSISQIAYTDNFSLTLIRNISHGPETILKIQVIITQMFNFSLTVNYILIQPLFYLQHQTFNLSTNSQPLIFKSRFKQSSTIASTYFLLGFSTLGVTPLLTTQQMNLEEEHFEEVQYNISFRSLYHYQQEQWIEFQFVIVYFLYNCSRGSVEHLQSVIGQKGHDGYRQIVAYNHKLHYMVGLAMFFSPNGSFIFMINQKRTVASGKGFRYNVVSLNMSCMIYPTDEDLAAEDNKPPEVKHKEQKKPQSEDKHKDKQNDTSANRTGTSEKQKQSATSETKQTTTTNQNTQTNTDPNRGDPKTNETSATNTTQPKNSTQDNTQASVAPPNSGKSLVFSLRLLPLLLLLYIY